MKIVKLSDGLGNQLFQYAFARALEKLTGDTVLLDRSWFPEFGENKLRLAVPRPFALGSYVLPLQYAAKKQSDAIVYGSGLAGTIRRWLHNRPGLLREGRDDLAPDTLCHLQGDRVFRGFFQSATYPEIARRELLGDLALPVEHLDEKNRHLAEEMASRPSVAVHIRRGDYLKEHSMQVHGICSAEYYAEAEARLRQQTGERLHLYLFSDDPEWVRSHYRTENDFTIVDANHTSQGHLDIELMRHCRYAITANSTFSWWGAWLNDAPGRIVIAPRRWFADGRDEGGLCPASWKRI